MFVEGGIGERGVWGRNDGRCLSECLIGEGVSGEKLHL